MSTPKKAVLEPLRVRLRRLQFTVGLGFLALMLGSMLSAALTLRLMDRVQALPFDFLRYAIALPLENLWVLAVLPLLCYGSARIIELRPWPTALGAAFTGQCFILALDYVRDGVDGWLERGWLLTLLEWAVFAGGAVLSGQAVIRGRAQASAQVAQAQQQASAKTDEYAEFLREAERAGEKIAQREAAKVEGQAPAPESPEVKPEDESKKPAA
ncbi:hypothetical protein JRI60_17300 [Archangium violaceum]|uniref:hypothetical protein n=1 Tax=Archangium violaceum TaxID=83451 RepID=UPI0019523CDD|nr:hypothetical protein [Archangium violaceum]QRO00659.1 hypothetical protein JRI60_17300 [Archangium violaceum]